MRNELARFAGISLYLTEISVKRADNFLIWWEKPSTGLARFAEMKFHCIFCNECKQTSRD